MGEMINVNVLLPVEVRDWLDREGAQQFRSMRAEAAARLTDMYRSATGVKVVGAVNGEAVAV